ncbi:AAT family amino acid transporter [Exophiala viscosa]|uniref:AAT family amino acid transporter n=1 Tax=Exophiala viscosa TaxID=2486360 RepID=A0AAN6DLC7_9EURO|nr:AAT family amino acid transporter [Exophiala viscosa]
MSDPKSEKVITLPSGAEPSDTEGEIQPGTVVENADQLKRHLGNRQIQLIAIGGSIGTALFVSIGGGLVKGGPGSLFLAYVIYCSLLGLVNNSMAEMAIFMPISGSFIRMAGKWVDDAFGFMAGWNFFLYEATLIPFEISALNLVLTFWSDNIPVGAICAACIVSYGALNLFAVKYYGEAEFWLASGKVLLIGVVFSFAFITMIGGNPQHDAYGFRYWNNPADLDAKGSFAEYITTGTLGRFEGFLGALWTAAFTIVGPEYLAMVAGEAKRPRVYLKAAFKTIGGSGTAGASPYVIAMHNMGITGLPHFTNALLVSSIFSAGNALTYCATRSLYGLALAGQAPRFLKKCTKAGIPVYCYLVTMIFPFLSFLAVSNGTSQVITWLVNLTEAAQMINYIVMSITYLFFFRALKAQGIDRKSLPYVGWWQPYCGWIGLCGMVVTVTCYGYATFLPGYWDVGTFFSYYTMVLLAPITFTGWKLVKRTKFVPASQADLVWDKPIIDAYEAALIDEPTGFWREVAAMLGLRKLMRLVKTKNQV